MTEVSLQDTEGTLGDVALLDFDSDGDLDVVIRTSSGGGNAYLLMNNGDATFAEAHHFLDAQNAGRFATGDFNGDGYDDLAIAGNGVSPIIFGPCTIEDLPEPD